VFAQLLPISLFPVSHLSYNSYPVPRFAVGKQPPNREGASRIAIHGGRPVFRRLTERFARDWTFRRRLPRDFGRVPLLVTPSAGLRYFSRSMDTVDPVLLGLVKEVVRPQSVVWDIGANVGLFTFAAASLAGPKGQVVALEPDAWLVQLLRRSASMQPSTSAPVKIVPAAVASSLSLRILCLAQRSRAANYLAEFGTIQTGGSREEQTIIALTLDWLLEFVPAPSVLKIDVEGAELEVFHGARKLFHTCRPVVLCEVIPNTAPAVTEFLVSQGYRIFDGETPLAQRQPLAVAPWSTLAIPD
jgi:FkbM family methyltransferase